MAWLWSDLYTRYKLYTQDHQAVGFSGLRDPSWVIAKSLPRNILKKTASVGPEILQLDVCTLAVALLLRGSCATGESRHERRHVVRLVPHLPRPAVARSADVAAALSRRRTEDDT